MSTQQRRIASLESERKSQTGGVSQVSSESSQAAWEYETQDAEVPSTTTDQNERIDENGNLTPFEINQALIRAAVELRTQRLNEQLAALEEPETPTDTKIRTPRDQNEQKKAIDLAKLGIIEQPEGETTTNTMLALARAGLDLATQYLPQGSDANRIATGTRGLLNNLGLPGAEADPRVEDFANRATRGVTTVRNILGGF
jgi:hypothetical protein